MHSLGELGTQGHIEDIVIKKEYQGKKFGVKLIEALDYIAGQVGCYKVRFFSFRHLRRDVNRIFRPSLIRHRERQHFMRRMGMRVPVLRCITILIRRQRNTTFEGGYSE